MVKYVYLHTPNIIPAVSRKYTYGYSRISIILKAINYPYCTYCKNILKRRTFPLSASLSKDDIVIIIYLHF